ncbi:MAG TPA: anthranilate synthase component I [Desulfotomaculum sp.]|nr:anthranilate synthase component I [Desulfotomaculum sp.]
MSRFYNLVPVSCEFPADTETPITLFRKTADGKPSFLLESVEGKEKIARYSFIGLDPAILYSHLGNQGQIKNSSGEVIKKVTGDPFQILNNLLSAYKTPVLTGLPRFFGGAVGYFGYEMSQWLERLPHTAEADLGLFDCMFMFCGTILIFDHLHHSLRVVVNNLINESPEKSYFLALEKIEQISKQLRAPIPGKNDFLTAKPEEKLSVSDIESNMKREEFLNSVVKAKEYIRSGDILQVVLSQRFRLPFEGNPFQIYRRLRSINPSPYLYYLNFGDLVIAGSSPEMLVRVEGEEVETRPIAGTRPRGATLRDDDQLSLELLNDPKERAEHVMLVDLGRNDLGRVCKPGTVEVPQFMEVEKYSHVMHLVSAVRGKLSPGLTAFDALKSCFPAGTVSGAPKVRAMEIIDELEPSKRGPYAGAVGYLSFNGNLDSAITIRTILFRRNHAYIQAGAGIVADSVPEREYQETVNKAQALFQTIALS